MVLILVVVLTLLAGMVALSSDRALTEAQAERDAFEGELDMLSTRDTLLFMLSTQRQTVGGLTVEEYTAPPRVSTDDVGFEAVMPIGTEIRLDGRVYGGLGNARFSFQEDRGLVSVAWPGPLLAAYLESLGASPERHAGYFDKLTDYQDPDDLRHLDGAERDHYERAGMPEPSNQPLATPLELRNVLGWNELLASQQDSDLLRKLTISRGGAFNINTAPAEVLALIPGMDMANAQRMVDVRNQTPFTSIYAAQSAFPLNALGDEGLNLFANRSGNLMLWDRRSGPRRLVHWTLSSAPTGLPPWRIDYEIRLARDEDPDQAVVTTPATPLFASASPPGS
ncbi:type II secretion system protein GspK [uncultured Luteimonas sp.]|uniref:type II secretion system protein GspK n=1 Tax=uncultured Luteimonas sp. TaxID=453144 RepID=UPI00261CB968|nr:type II secretion system protein GspK [uncultured Luteimonas sp.]